MMDGFWESLGYRTYSCSCGYECRTKKDRVLCPSCFKEVVVGSSRPGRRTTPPSQAEEREECLDSCSLTH